MPRLNIGDTPFPARFSYLSAKPSIATFDLFSDLILLSEWQELDGNAYVSKGYLANVINDSDTQNGTYILLGNGDYTISSNWIKNGGAGGGFDSGSLYSGIAEIHVGSIEVGETFVSASMQTMWDALIKQELYPTLVNPTSNFNLVESGLHEVGELITTLHFSSSFDRGDITPAYGTYGFRSGIPNTYNYTGTGLVDVNSTALFDVEIVANYTVISGNQNWTNSVSFDVGEQPLSSYGNNYDFPLSANDTLIQTETIQGIYPFYWGWLDEETDIFDGITQPQILSLPNMNKYIQPQGTKTITTSPTNGRYCIMFPSTYSALTSIIDNNNFETLPAYNIYNYNVNGLDGINNTFKVYILNADTTSINFTNIYHF